MASPGAIVWMLQHTRASSCNPVPLRSASPARPYASVVVDTDSPSDMTHFRGFEADDVFFHNEHPATRRPSPDVNAHFTCLSP